MAKIFISHSSSDTKLAYRLKEQLESINIEVWLDIKDINVGDTLVGRIMQGIEKCDYLLILISASSLSSNWVNKELTWAMTREINDDSFAVLPVLLDNSPIPPILSDKLYFKINTKNKNHVSKIVTNIVKKIFSDGNSANMLLIDNILSKSKILQKIEEKEAIYSSILGISVLFFIFSAYATEMLLFGIGLSVIGILKLIVLFRFERIFKNNLSLLKKIEKIGYYFIPFDRKYYQQLNAGKNNKKYIFTLYLEVFSQILMFVIAILFIILSITLSNSLLD